MRLLAFRFEGPSFDLLVSVSFLNVFSKTFLIFAQTDRHFHWKILGIRNQSDDKTSIYLVAFWTQYQKKKQLKEMQQIGRRSLQYLIMPSSDVRLRGMQCA